MKVKIKVDGKRIEVDCVSKECPGYECFGFHKYWHYGESIDGSRTSWQDSFYSCPHRNYHGCPEHPKMKEEI